MKPLILCGGVGTKMWPLSRSKLPKHFLPLLGEKSLFQLNYQALRLKFQAKDIYIQTNAVQAEIARRQVPEVPKKNYFIEPEMRNHGPATGFAAAKFFKIDPDEPFILVQTDILREPAEEFVKMIEEFDFLIKRDGKLMTGGIEPKYYAEGVDYLLAGERVNQKRPMAIYRMKKWLWRDKKDEIKSYFGKKKLFLHANHYAWTPRLLLDSYKRRAPEWYLPLEKMIAAFGTGKEEEVVAEEYAKMPAEPIEKVTQFELENGYVAELNFDWIDFGTWGSLGNYIKSKKTEVSNDNVLQIGAEGCCYRLPKEKFLALIGVKDLFIVDTGDALLVCSQDQSGRVKEVVDHLKNTKRDNLL